MRLGGCALSGLSFADPLRVGFHHGSATGSVTTETAEIETGVPSSPPPRDGGPAKWWRSLPTFLLVAGAVGLIAWFRPGAWLTIVVLLLGAALARVAGWTGRELRVVALALAVTVAAVDYLAWRTTVLSWAGWFIGIPLLLAEAHAALHAVGLQITMWPRRENPPRRDVNPTDMPIFVFVPTVDEGIEILGETLRGILAARTEYLAQHPNGRLQVVVCNDGDVADADCSDDVIALCAHYDVVCITRTVGGGAKAGNVENARQIVGAVGNSLVAIFDADQIPTRDFFTSTVPWFSDGGVGWVQTGQYYRNRANPVTRWADDQQSLFYRLLCPAKASRSAAFICGTNVVMRARALDEIGGLPQDSVTEDFAASVLLAPRWRSVFLRGIYAAGLGPLDFPSYLKQQERWARGTLTVLRRYGGRLVRPSSGLTSDQRVQYGLAMTHYLSGVRDIIFVIAPLLFILTGISGVQGATTQQFFEHFVPYYALTMIAFWHAAAVSTSWRSVVIGFASAPALARATWSTVTGNFGRFTLTPKSRAHHNFWRVSAPYIIGLAACVTAIVVALTDRRGPAVYLAAAWTVYLAALFTITLFLLAADARSGGGAHAPENNLPILRSETSGRLAPPGSDRRLSNVIALAVLALLLPAWLIFVLSSSGPTTSTPPGKPAASLTTGQAAASPGVSGADRQRVEQLAGSLGPGEVTVGRTFEIADRLDTEWAQRVTDAGGTPWITLVFSENGSTTLGSSLTAIANGVHDDALRQWAGDIAAFGEPIYLTVLPLVDRDFAASSAVARGGIPSDSAAAWRHIRAVAEQERARNIAWVWAPADPAYDIAYAPREEDLDVIGLTWFSYPGSSWVDPERAIEAATLRHPGKPLLIQVSAPPVQQCPIVDLTCTTEPSAYTDRTRWLDAVRTAVDHRSDIATLVYQDGGPYLDSDDPRAVAWRMPDPTLWAPGRAGAVR